MALVEVKVPDIGDFKDVAVIELLVKPGDTVAVDQSLVTVESDKASMEIPSSVAGVVRELKVALGDKINQGDLLAMLEGAVGAAPAAAEAAAPPAAAPAPAPEAASALASVPAAAPAVASVPAATSTAPVSPVPAHQPEPPSDEVRVIPVELPLCNGPQLIDLSPTIVDEVVSVRYFIRLVARDEAERAIWNTHEVVLYRAGLTSETI